ncbi:MAG TPA: CshA/CshB family fibrillar adhesin-related protein [Acidimicrobiales bacterium]
MAACSPRWAGGGEGASLVHHRCRGIVRAGGGSGRGRRTGAAGGRRHERNLQLRHTGHGTYASTLCWFDLSGYNAAAAATAGGQSMSVSLPGGYTISFALHLSGRAVTPVAFPTFGDAYLGNNGHYTGVGGNPALYQNNQGAPGATTATLDNISVRDVGGAALSGYAFVGADAESTDNNESVTWTSNTPLTLISTIGNSCNSGALLTGLGTTTVQCAATVSGTKTGTPILAAQAPTTLGQRMVGSGRQAVAFGVLVSTVQLTKTVVDRLDPADSFGVAIGTSSGSVLASANTGGGVTATTGPITVLTSNQGSDYILSEQVTSGLASNYTVSWSCTRNGVADDDLPSADAGPSATVTLGIGDFVNCTITNTARR